MGTLSAVEPDSAREPDDNEDPFGVRLEWPEELIGAPMDRPAASMDRPTAASEDAAEPPAPEEDAWSPPPSPAPAASPAPPPRPEPEVAPPRPAPDDASRELIAGVVARVEALTAATVTFRNLVSDRVSEYTERVIQATAATAAEADEQRRTNERALAELRSGLTRTNAAVERLAAAVEAVPSELERISTDLAAQLERVADEVQTLRRRTAVRPRAAVGDRSDEEAAPKPRRPPRKRTN